jgi:hypothetical protein
MPRVVMNENAKPDTQRDQDYIVCLAQRGLDEKPAQLGCRW